MLRREGRGRLAMRLLVLATGLLALAAAGCGGGSSEPAVRARGRVTLGGQPLAVTESNRQVGLGSVKVEFYRIGPDGRQSDVPESMVVDQDGSFELEGREGRGIPPGKYRIAVYQFDPDDKLGGRFDKDRSPIVREVTGEEDLVIELTKPAG